MSINDNPTLDQIFTLAVKLPRQERAALITRLVQDLAAPVPPTPTPIVAANSKSTGKSAM